MVGMRQFSFRLTDGKESRFLLLHARDHAEAEMKVERWCKGTKWRWPIFDYE